MHASRTLVAALVTCLTATIADAAPTVVATDIAPAGVVEKAQSWRYHNDCSWRGGRWVADLGVGRLVICRPHRPGRDYQWRSEGRRQGWYDNRRRSWHHNQW